MREIHTYFKLMHICASISSINLKNQALVAGTQERNQYLIFLFKNCLPFPLDIVWKVIHWNYLTSWVVKYLKLRVCQQSNQIYINEKPTAYLNKPFSASFSSIASLFSARVFEPFKTFFTLNWYFLDLFLQHTLVKWWASHTMFASLK